MTEIVMGFCDDFGVKLKLHMRTEADPIFIIPRRLIEQANFVYVVDTNTWLKLRNVHTPNLSALIESAPRLLSDMMSEAKKFRMQPNFNVQYFDERINSWR